MPDARSLLSPGFKTDPYWWDAAPRPARGEDVKPPDSTDVAIVGSGHTGLAAALTLARAGRHVTIFEADTPGYGASTRNAGYVGRTLYSKFFKLQKTFGTAKAIALAQEGVAAHDFVADLIEREQLACRYVNCGRFIAAETRKHYDHMAREFEALARHVPTDVTMVPRADQRREIASDRYHGGAALNGTGALHPGLYHNELMHRVIGAGAAIVGHTPVTGVRSDGKGFEVATPRGRTKARNVVVATNGYTGSESPAVRRRVIPVSAYMIATEPLGAERMGRLLPTLRTMIDTKINIFWARPSPDGERMLFGARTGIDEGPLEKKAVRLHAHMVEVFPDLAEVKITHCWTGNMGFSFDLLPHHGVIDGVHYAAGFCGVGIPMGSYLGHKTALKILGQRGGATAFDDLPFPTRPFFEGRPWFMPAVIRWYGLRDRMAR